MNVTRHDRHRLAALPLVATVLFAVAQKAPAEPPQYNLDLLGPASDVEDINAHGEVIGGYSPVGGGDMRAYVAGPDHPHELLPLPAGYSRSWANGINDAGVIVGGVTDIGYPNEHGVAAKWTPDDQGGYDVELLDLLPGYTMGVAVDINNRGDIIGHSFFSPGLGPGVWFNSPTGILNITTLLGAPSRMEAINDEGVIVGFNGELFDLDTLEPVPLPPDPLGLTGLYAINEIGEVAGGYGTGNSSGAVRWTRDAGWELIGQTGGQSAQIWAWSINNDGLAIADTFGPPPWYFHVAIHDSQNGTMPLEALIAPDQGNWFVFTLTGGAIDDSGRIAVIVQSADTSAYGVAILTPVAAPSPGDVDADGDVDVTDLIAMLSVWGPCPDPCAADFDGDGDVDAGDLLVLLANWS